MTFDIKGENFLASFVDMLGGGKSIPEVIRNDGDYDWMCDVQLTEDSLRSLLVSIACWESTLTYWAL